MKKRIIAVLSAISVTLTSSACITQFVSADNANDYTCETNIVTDEWLSKNQNLLADKWVKIDSTLNGQSKDFGKIKSATDNKTDSRYDIWATGENKSAVTSFVYSLGVKQSISRFVVSSEGTVYTPQEFGIYASDDLDTLFTGNPIVKYSSATPLSAKSFLFTLKSPVSARYVGFKFTRPNKNTFSRDNDQSLLISELGAYSDYGSINFEEGDRWLNISQNILNNKTITVKDYNAANPTEAVLSDAHIAALTDKNRNNDYAIWSNHQ